MRLQLPGLSDHRGSPLSGRGVVAQTTVWSAELALTRDDQNPGSDLGGLSRFRGKQAGPLVEAGKRVFGAKMASLIWAWAVAVWRPVSGFQVLGLKTHEMCDVEEETQGWEEREAALEGREREEEVLLK